MKKIAPKVRPHPVARAAARLIKAMDWNGHENFMLIDSFTGERPHAVVIAVNTPQKAARLLRQIGFKARLSRVSGKGERG